MVEQYPVNTQSAPLVSVCIANYNGELFIRECIESVLNQVDAPSFEIIVHDDASTDASVDAISAFPCIRVLRSSENIGFCASNNRMARAARGQYLLLLNNDAMLFPDALRTLYEAAALDGAEPVLSPPQYDYFDGTLLDRGLKLDPFANPVPVKKAGDANLAMVMGACLWISTRLWKQLGGLPEWMESIGEDLYLCCHARLAGHPVRVTGGSGYRHMVGRSFGGGSPSAGRLSTTRRRRSLSERNKTFVMITFFPLPLLIPLLPLHYFLLLAEGLALALLNRDYRILTQIYIGAIRSGWKFRSTLKLARKRVRESRRASWFSFLSPMVSMPRKLQMAWQYGVPEIR